MEQWAFRSALAGSGTFCTNICDGDSWQDSVSRRRAASYTVNRKVSLVFITSIIIADAQFGHRNEP
jgi:hypothetical protein